MSRVYSNGVCTANADVDSVLLAASFKWIFEGKKLFHRNFRIAWVNSNVWTRLQELTTHVSLLTNVDTCMFPT